MAAVKAILEADLVAIRFCGRDFYGELFDVYLGPEDARRLLFKLHRVILAQEKMKQNVNAAHDGGKVA